MTHYRGIWGYLNHAQCVFRLLFGCSDQDSCYLTKLTKHIFMFSGGAKYKQ